MLPKATVDVDILGMNRALTIVAVLFLAFFVSTSEGFANLSSIQEQLRTIQVKIIKERIKQIQDQIVQLNKDKAKEASVAKVVVKEEPQLSVDELSKRLENQIKSIEVVIKALKPKAMEEEAARLEKRIADINKEIVSASGERLLELQDELGQVLADYTRLQDEIKQALSDSIRHKQVLALQEQIRILQGKIKLLPREPIVPKKPVSEDNTEQIKQIQESIQKIQLKIIQTQTKEIQQSIDKFKAK